MQSVTIVSLPSSQTQQGSIYSYVLTWYSVVPKMNLKTGYHSVVLKVFNTCSYSARACVLPLDVVWCGVIGELLELQKMVRTLDTEPKLCEVLALLLSVVVERGSHVM